MNNEKRKSRFTSAEGMNEYCFGQEEGVYRVACGVSPEGIDLCSVDILNSDRPYLTEQQAIGVATDLLAWAKFVRQCRRDREIMDYAENYYDCTRCNGHGRFVLDGVSQECPDCEGEGEVDAKGFAPSYSNLRRSIKKAGKLI